MSCHACERIELIRRRENPYFIAELSESYAVLADDQGCEGWCILLTKEHHEHLALLPVDRQARLWTDVARVSAAMTTLLRPTRINYECLGNQLHHIHWHVIPRHADDPDPKMPIWVRPKEQIQKRLPDARRDELVRMFRDEIGRGS